MVLDGAKEGVNQHRQILERELETVGLRLNKTPPNVYFRQERERGGEGWGERGGGHANQKKLYYDNRNHLLKL